MSRTDSFAGFNLTSSKLQFVEVSVNDKQIELVNVNEVFLNEEKKRNQSFQIQIFKCTYPEPVCP